MYSIGEKKYVDYLKEEKGALEKELSNPKLDEEIREERKLSREVAHLRGKLYERRSNPNLAKMLSVMKGK